MTLASRLAVVCAGVVLSGCSAEADGTGTETGGTAGIPTPGGGGMTASGGAATSGGATASGATSAGGNATSGGATATGGSATSAGGATTSGGTTSAGGATSGGATSGGSGGAPVTPGDAIIAAPDGVDSAPGTLAAPTTLGAALTRVAAGGTIALRGGTYAFSTQITVDAANSGSAAQRKTLMPYGAEKPLLDFSSQPYGTASNPRGLQINGSYWHVRGLEVKGSADNGIYVSGKNNIVESCVTHGNRDTGLQLGRAASSQASIAEWPSDNLILNCESYDNYDGPPGGGENADGFAAKLTVGPGNVFRGCVAHHNIDDGWDLYTKSDTGPIGSVTIDGCVAHHNGTLTNGTSNENGDRNGFKLGGEKIAVSHTVTRSIAFANGKNGFTWNSNPGQIRLFNNLAFDNAEGNYVFGTNSVSTQAVFANNVSFWSSTSADASDKTIGTDVSSSNVFWDTSKTPPSVSGKGLSVTAADFAAALSGAKVVRRADGTLDLSAFALASGSDLGDAGVIPPGTLPFDAAGYYSGAPDLGAVESR